MGPNYIEKMQIIEVFGWDQGFPRNYTANYRSANWLEDEKSIDIFLFFSNISEVASLPIFH